jgi:hypothetical protein
MNDWLFRGDFVSAPTNVPAMLLGLALAFLGGHIIAWVYMATHTGLSYSKSFVNSLMVIPSVVALVMMVLSNSLVTAFGLMAVFAIVRFRNILRDTLDASYILMVIVLGMAAGTMKFSTAIVGTMFLCALMVYLWMTGFGTRHRYDMILNFHWAGPQPDRSRLEQLLDDYSLKAVCASERKHEGFAGSDLSYRLLLKNPQTMPNLLEELQGYPGVSRVTGMKAEEESEV